MTKGEDVLMGYLPDNWPCEFVNQGIKCIWELRVVLRGWSRCETETPVARTIETAVVRERCVIDFSRAVGPSARSISRLCRFIIRSVSTYE